jgi:hypothetical protein
MATWLEASPIMILCLGGSLLTLPKAACNNGHSASGLNVAGHMFMVETFFSTNPVLRIIYAEQ